MNPEKHPGAMMPEIAAPVERHDLDISDPSKWQMKVRVYLESLRPQDRSIWLDNIRLIAMMAGRIDRDLAHRINGERCIICGGPWRDGRPQGSGQYMDAERQPITVYICAQSEYSDMLKYIHEKEMSLEKAEQRATQAARKAATDARSRVMSSAKI